jgi:hypothetical protein
MSGNGRTSFAVIAAVAGLAGLGTMASMTLPTGPHYRCGVNICGADGDVANRPILSPPCSVIDFHTAGGVTAFAARTSCTSPATEAYVLERNALGRSKKVSVGVGDSNQVTGVRVSPDGAHVVFRAGRGEGAHNWRLWRAGPHGAGSAVPITPSSADETTSVEPHGWEVDCGSAWVRYTQFDQVSFATRYAPLLGGTVVDTPPPGATWGECGPVPIFRDGFESGTKGEWS